MTSLTLTQEQRRIVGHAGKSVLIGAVAGSGKTTTLAHCVAYRQRAGLAAQDILVLVFTPAAEQVFRERLRQAKAPRDIHVSTYAALAAGLLDGWQEHGVIDGAERRLANAQALRPFLFEAIEAAAAEAQADPDYAFDLSNLHAEIVVKQLSRLKGTLAMRRFDDEDDHELADSLDLPRGLIAICRRLERMRRLDIGHYAFQSEHDLVPDALEVLEHVGEYAVLPRLGLIVADEWHDANAAHVDLLRRLAGPDTQVIAAGDREQVVHSWNGADPRHMGEVYTALFPDTQRLPLTASFRCGRTLSACAAALTGQPFVSSRPTDTALGVQRYEGGAPDACTELVVARLQTLAASGAPLSDCAVLLRSPHQSIALENALIRHGIAYSAEGFDSYFNRVEILMLRGLLLIVRKLREGATLARAAPVADIKAIVRALGQFAGLQRSERTWADVERTIADDPDNILHFYQAWLKDAPPEDNAASRWRRQFVAVCEALKERPATQAAGTLLAEAARGLKLADAARRLFVFERDARAVSRSIDGFVAHAAATGLPVADFLDATQAAQRQSASMNKRQHRVTLATARDAKGKEWRHVLLPYLVDGEFPDAREDAGEERRLFYVAMTRASDTLSLYVPEGHAHSFVEAMRIGETAEAPAAAPSLRRYLNVPFDDKDAAKQLGARWDPIQRQWWVPASAATQPFARWLAPR